MQQIKSFNNCPLCQSFKRSKSFLSYKNRYSEEIAEDLNINENKLLNLLSNVTCNKCGLVYKKNWFTKDYLEKLFNKLVPVHPKGWDIISKKFNKKNFLERLNLFSHSSRNKNKYKRELYSIVQNINVIGKSDKKKIITYLKNIKKENIKYLLENKKPIKNMILVPKKYSRFSGFKSENFYNHIEKKIGKIKNYMETGCPLWGMLQLASKKKCNASFIKNDHSHFWGKNCKRNGNKCINKIEKNIKILEIENNNKKFDFFGCFFLLDHTTNPLKFVTTALRKSKSIGFLLETINKKKSIYSDGIAIQHFSGWTKEPMYFLTKKLKKKLDYSFKEIENSNFFLIY